MLTGSGSGRIVGVHVPECFGAIAGTSPRQCTLRGDTIYYSENRQRLEP